MHINKITSFRSLFQWEWNAANIALALTLVVGIVFIVVVIL